MPSVHPDGSDGSASGAKDTTKAILDEAPEMKKATFSAEGDVQAEGAKVDAYWEAHPMVKASD